MPFRTISSDGDVDDDVVLLAANLKEIALFTETLFGNVNSGRTVTTHLSNNKL